MYRKWKDITTIFNFPPTTTDASFVLHKYYITLLYHYEQVYFFGAQGQPIPPPANLSLHHVSNVLLFPTTCANGIVIFYLYFSTAFPAPNHVSHSTNINELSNPSSVEAKYLLKKKKKRF